MIMALLVDTDRRTLHLEGMRSIKLDLIKRGIGADKAVAIWLAVIGGMVAAMVIIGGITRVTGSGLSMVEWRPLLGWFPPLSEQEWQRVFKLYQNSPEYRYINTWMDLNAFKGIFWWEYIHRLWGRLIGIVFFLPFIFFLITKKIKRTLLSRICFLFVLGGLQGALGWWMVKSGLSSDPSVSQYRLATHLGMAFLILGLLIWTILDLVGKRDVLGSRATVYHANTVTVLVFLTVIGGALVAGLKAGLVYNTFPLMGESMIPPDYFSVEPYWRNIFENVPAVQFNHRILATITLLAIVSLCVCSRFFCKTERLLRTIYVMTTLAILQFLLGVLTLVNFVPEGLAVAHQFIGLCLFGTSVVISWGVRIPRDYTLNQANNI
ncbi:COX15/CtaA family protein [Alphaproteobacteria bacterium]|nr:COX15/CtaA family protein [Alphaproteobacteria bacterium]